MRVPASRPGHPTARVHLSLTATKRRLTRNQIHHSPFPIFCPYRDVSTARAQARHRLPPTVKLEALAASRVDEVMSTPELWPVQVVEGAISVLATKKGAQLPPLAKVARDDNWDVG